VVQERPTSPFLFEKSDPGIYAQPQVDESLSLLPGFLDQFIKK
jgi:hypothetical protein